MTDVSVAVNIVYRVKVRDLKKLLNRLGWELLAKRGKGSHAAYFYQGHVFTVPGKDGDDLSNTVKKTAREIIRELHSDEDAKCVK